MTEKIALDGTFPQTRSANALRYGTHIPSVAYIRPLTPSNLDVNTIDICQNPWGRPEDRYVNFLIQQMVFPFEGRSLSGTTHTEKSLTAEVAAEEAGPWRFRGKRLRVEDLSKVCRTVVFHGASGGG